MRPVRAEEEHVALSIVARVVCVCKTLLHTHVQYMTVRVSSVSGSYCGLGGEVSTPDRVLGPGPRPIDPEGK